MVGYRGINAINYFAREWRCGCISSFTYFVLPTKYGIHRMEREREASCKCTWKSFHGLKNLSRTTEHLMYLPTFIHTNISGKVSPLAGGPNRNREITMSGDSLFSTLPISPIEMDGSFLTSKYPGSISQPKVRQLPPKHLPLSSTIGQATMNGAGSPWSQLLASCSTGNSPCIGCCISWDSYQREFRRKDAD